MFLQTVKAPLIVKEASLAGHVKSFGSRVLPKAKQLFSNVDPGLYRKTWLSNPHVGMSLVGAGAGGYTSYKRQVNRVQSGQQDNVSLGRVAGGAAIGAGAGLGLSAIKPVGNAWTRLTAPKLVDKEKASRILDMNPEYVRHYISPRPKLFSKEYFQNTWDSIKHPIKHLKAKGVDSVYRTYMDNGSHTLYRRSPVGAALGVGMTATYLGPTAKRIMTDKDKGVAEKATRMAALGLGYANPYMLPYMAMNSVPDIIWNNKRSKDELTY